MKKINITLKPVVDFSNARVGDNVFCTHLGAGKIKRLNLDNCYPVEVCFSSPREEKYTVNGRLWRTRCAYASLYFYDPETQDVLYYRPEPEIDWAAYEGKMIEVRDEDNEAWRPRRLWKHASGFVNSFLCHSVDGSTVVPWNQARLIGEVCGNEL